jgi:hypothetical protein
VASTKPSAPSVSAARALILIRLPCHQYSSLPVSGAEAMLLTALSSRE